MRAVAIPNLPNRVVFNMLFSALFSIAIAFEPSSAALCAWTTGAFRSTPVLASVADFSGEWCMDLKASDSLGPVLRELGTPRMLAAIVTRLAVTQRIVQTGSTVTIEVKTPLSAETLGLNLDGSEALLPGVTGGHTRASTRWLDQERLETRQCVDQSGRLDDPDARLFVTTRSLFDAGAGLLEDCAVVARSSGEDMKPRATAKRILRRVVPSRASTTSMLMPGLQRSEDDGSVLTESSVEAALSDLREQAKAFFGCHPESLAIGITGDVTLLHLDGPCVVVQLSGAFWHRRETVLANTAAFLMRRIPEIAEVTVPDEETLLDVLRDEETGEIIEDRRAPDLTGDRQTLIYQGIDPDTRGPFASGYGGFRVGGSIFS